MHSTTAEKLTNPRLPPAASREHFVDAERIARTSVREAASPTCCLLPTQATAASEEELEMQIAADVAAARRRIAVKAAEEPWGI